VAWTTISNGFVINSFVSMNIPPSIYKIVILFELMTTLGAIVTMVMET
jgi:hypothetical protein